MEDGTVNFDVFGDLLQTRCSNGLTINQMMINEVLMYDRHMRNAYRSDRQGWCRNACFDTLCTTSCMCCLEPTMLTA